MRARWKTSTHSYGEMREKGETILYSPFAPVLLVSLVLFMLNWPSCDLLPKICTLPQPQVPAATPPRHRQGQRWKAQSCVILEFNTFQKSSNPNIYIQNSGLYTIPDINCGWLPEYKSASDKNAKQDQSVSIQDFLTLSGHFLMTVCWRAAHTGTAPRMKPSFLAWRNN